MLPAQAYFKLDLAGGYVEPPKAYLDKICSTLRLHYQLMNQATDVQELDIYDVKSFTL